MTNPTPSPTDPDAAPTMVARTAERTPVRLMGKLREQGHSALEIEVHDLSVSGFQVNTVYRLRPNTLVWLQIGGLAPLPARVRWFREYRIGCAFETPLHQSVLDRIVASAAPR